VPLRDAAEILESAGADQWVMRRSDFSGGVGVWRRREGARSLRGLTGYWFGRNDSFIPGQLTPPLLSTVDTPTDISNPKTDYAAMTEWVDSSGAAFVYLVKGTQLWRTQTTAFGAVVKLLSGAQGRQLVPVPSDGSAPYLVWVCGAGAGTQISTSGTSWSNLWPSGTADDRLLDLGFWLQIDVSELAGTGFFGRMTTKPGGINEFIAGGVGTGSPASAGTGQRMANWGTTSPAFIGHITTNKGYVTNGPWIAQFNMPGVGYNLAMRPLRGPFSDNLGGCEYGDEFAVFCRDDIALFHPSRPHRYIGPWRDGCPPDISGSFKSIISYNGYLIAYWEMDSASPVPTAGQGNTIIFWGRPNEAGEWTWHARSAKKSDGTDTDLIGGFPLSCGQAMVMAEGSVSGGGKRRLWVPTADGTAGRLYWQEHPLPGWNPLFDTTMQYEDGPLYTYDAHQDLIMMGHDAAGLMEVERNAYFPEATSGITVDYRMNYDDAASEEAGGADWRTLLTLDERRRSVKVASTAGQQGLTVQLRVGIDRVIATKPPVLRDLGILAERQARSPALERT